MKDKQKIKIIDGKKYKVVGKDIIFGNDVLELIE